MVDSDQHTDSLVNRRRFVKAAGVTGVAGLLAGCSGGDSTTTNGGGNGNGGNGNGGTTTGNQTSKTFTLEYIDVDGDRTKEMFMPVIEELNSKYDAEISLNFREVPYGNYKKQLLTRVGGGNAPDVAAIDQIWLGSFYNSGKLMTFNDIQEQINFDDYFAGFKEAVVQEENIVGFPITTDVRGMYWNKDQFESAGLDPNTGPETWSEFYDVAAQLHDPPNRYGTGIIVAAGIYSVPLFSAGGQFLKSGGSEPAFTSDAGVKGAEFIDKIYNEEKIGPSSPITGGGNYPQEFLNGTYSIAPVYGSWMDFFARQKGMSNEEIKQKYGFSISPHPSSGSPATMMGGFAWSAFNTTDRPDIVKDFMGRISGQEFNRKIARETGRIPTRKALLDASEVWSNILWSDTIKEMLEYGGTRPVNNWSAVDEILTTSLQEVAYDRAEPREALQSAADELAGEL
ncbi:ABC transporter substrate-binding protein [Halorhabdus amylolytica]|uniref:ABC transporter substrate-binding protein n=1 Tax=Halorhabdus amylolytica TaxID=2559573 RepID=UPI0010AAB60E|nr:substrate-binding domain-containing protein [Halorhabdus amylolytica]